MDQLKKYQPIDEQKLDQGLYFQALFQEACRLNLLNQSQIERIQYELIELMGKEVDRFTNGESSSVLIEKAQGILQSITYNLGVYLKSVSGVEQRLELLKSEKISDLFYKGMDTVLLLKKEAEQIFKKLQLNRLGINNIAYQDTLSKGISLFFHDYDEEFYAQDIPCDIDYPLFKTEIKLLGVEWILEYLRNMALEDNFLRCFTEENINHLLVGFHKDSEHMLINIFELVLNNALGCAILELPVKALNIRPGECSYLSKQLVPLSEEEIQGKLEKALKKVMLELNIAEDIKAYTTGYFSQLAGRIYRNLRTNSLKEIFISFSNQALEEEIFEEGLSMSDERLRELIGELSEIKSVKDKLTLIRETVHSLTDFIELLEECFYGSEYEEVVASLNDIEKRLLINCIKEEAGPERLEDYKPEKEWQMNILKLLNI